jgi:hypothetical protein
MPEHRDRLWWDPDVVVVRVRPVPDLPAPPLARREDFLTEFYDGGGRRRRLVVLVLVLIVLLAAAGVALGLALAKRGGTPTAPGALRPPAAIVRSAA